MPGDGLHSTDRPSNILVMPDMFIPTELVVRLRETEERGRMFENSTGRFSRLPATGRWTKWDRPFRLASVRLDGRQGLNLLVN